MAELTHGTEAGFRAALAAAGLDVEIRETHRAHGKAVSAIVRASKPADAAEIVVPRGDAVGVE